MRRIIYGLAGLILLLLGFIIGAVSTARYLLNPRLEYLKIQANALTTVVALSELRKSNLDYVIQSKECELDATIVALGNLIRDDNKYSMDARNILRRVREYRVKVGYVPNSPESRRLVDDAFQLCIK